MTDDKRPLARILIYTDAGDVDGVTIDVSFGAPIAGVTPEEVIAAAHIAVTQLAYQLPTIWAHITAESN